MTQEKFIGSGLTYDDVLLVPAFSEILPRDVAISYCNPKRALKELKWKSKFNLSQCMKDINKIL